MKNEYKKVSLDTLGNGAATELFERELQAVLDNIEDENTDPKFTRNITLTVTFQPGLHRDVANIEIKCKSKMAPVKAFPTTVWLAKEGRKNAAYEHNVHQPSLGLEENVVEMKTPKS